MALTYSPCATCSAEQLLPETVEDSVLAPRAVCTCCWLCLPGAGPADISKPAVPTTPNHFPMCRPFHRLAISSFLPGSFSNCLPLKRIQPLYALPVDESTNKKPANDPVRLKP